MCLAKNGINWQASIHTSPRVRHADLHSQMLDFLAAVDDEYNADV